MHDDVSSWHVEVHLSVPPLKEALNFVQEFIEPKLLPSQVSPGSSSPLPQSGTLMHDDVSSLQLFVHFNVPPIKLVKFRQLLIAPYVFVSHSSPGWFIKLSPHLVAVFGMHPEVSSLQVFAHFKVPPINSLL